MIILGSSKVFPAVSHFRSQAYINGVTEGMNHSLQLIIRRCKVLIQNSWLIDHLKEICFFLYQQKYVKLKQRLSADMR